MATKVTVKQNGKDVDVELKELDMSLVTPDEIAQGLTDREAQALAGKRGGLTDAETTAAMGITTVNQIGNFRRAAEVKLGLREAGSGRSGGKGVSIPGADAMVKQALAPYESKVESARKVIDTLQAEIDDFDDKAVVKSMKADLTAKAERLRTEADEIDKRVKRPNTQWAEDVAAHKAELVKRVDTARTDLATGEAELEIARTAMADAIAKVEALKAS